MTELVELPGVPSGIIAVDPHSVTAVQPYRRSLPSKGAQVFDMCAVWVANRNIYLCAWSVEQTLEVLNAARQRDAELFAAGYREGVADALAGAVAEQSVKAAWIVHLALTRTEEAS